MARIFKIDKYDVANGPGVRTSIWFSGCDRGCVGCHNVDIQSFEAGEEFDELMLAEIETNLLDPQIDGRLSILGGEPMARINIKELNSMLYYLRSKIPNLNVWLWTGHDYEYLLNRDLETYQTIEQCDVIIDGPFIATQKTLNHPYKGSENQRVVLVQNSLSLGVTVVDGAAMHY